MGQGIHIKISTGAILAAALALLILPLPLLSSLFVAATIHELGHYLALCWMGVRIYGISINPFGAVIETDVMSPGKEALCALAGPAGSFLLVASHRIFPEIALCALVQGCFNMLPVYPLDGGRALTGILEMLKIPCKDRILPVLRWLTGLVIGFGCGYGFLVWDLGWGTVILGVMLLLRIFPRKTPCKEGSFGVQ